MPLKAEHFKKVIAERLSQVRYEHSVAVAEEAVRLAKMYGADAEKSEAAGLLHDIMKDSESAEQLKLIERAGLILDSVTKVSPKLWHSLAGAAYIRLELGIEDEDIINAVRYHTTARKNMSLLEKIVYLADYTSKDRTYEGVRIMRNAVNTSIDKGMREALRFTVRELVDSKRPIDKNTISAYNEQIIKKGAL